MNIQIFGIKKCFDTKKAERYFKERKIKYQLVDLSIKGLSKGEFQSVKNAVGLDNMINKTSKIYEKSDLKKVRTESIKEELLFKDYKLLKTPIVRNGKQATVGYEPDVWKKWE
ncbi:arsenate reductase family protein [Hathewaya limosa]|uniref:Arsenate reductase-like glutaredoxin family protein n=1 Tax=Hathewaya limosa TaxID=1536 RepID=A0ABU0JXN6_HATLI|nr:arsenate reductase family protein [Hathewaya limosa]AWZ47688.1 ArsC family transcriptional regulator [Clostridiaceae bacterium 14S0207]MDQ0480864.1 arsenate reductase-like glutaredoxin family protein [Hathewaya limosa]